MTADFPLLDALQTSCQRANAAGANVGQMSAFSAKQMQPRVDFASLRKWSFCQVMCAGSLSAVNYVQAGRWNLYGTFQK